MSGEYYLKRDEIIEAPTCSQKWNSAQRDPDHANGYHILMQRSYQPPDLDLLTNRSLFFRNMTSTPIIEKTHIRK